MRTVLKSEYDTLLNGGEILEQDGHGVKVVRLPDGRFLKTFWYRRLLSSRRIYPEWLRFVLHAGALKRRGIPTVTVLESLRVPHLKRTALIYRPLEGRTLRQVAAVRDFSPGLARDLGQFMARLHRRGIHFHSLHLGNVLLCSDGSFGLIDVSNMRIFPWPLWANTRMRNFIHLFRYPEDLQVLTDTGIWFFMDGYLSERSSRRTRRKVRSFFSCAKMAEPSEEGSNAAEECPVRGAEGCFRASCAAAGRDPCARPADG